MQAVNAQYNGIHTSSLWRPELRISADTKIVELGSAYDRIQYFENSQWHSSWCDASSSIALPATAVVGRLLATAEAQEAKHPTESKDEKQILSNISTSTTTNKSSGTNHSLDHTS